MRRAATERMRVHEARNRGAPSSVRVVGAGLALALLGLVVVVLKVLVGH